MDIVTSFSLSDPLLLTVGVALLSAVAVGGVGWAFVGTGGSGERRQKRIQELTGKEGLPRARAAQKDLTRERRRIVQETLKELEEKQKEHKARQSIKRQLEQAGLEISMPVFYGASAGFGVTCGLLAFVFGLGPWVSLGAIFIAGLGVPRWAIGFMCGSRKRAFAEEFANAIDVIVRGVKSGLPLNECLNIIARESQDPVKTEFQALVDAQRMGVPIDQALDRMYESMPIPEVNFFAIVLGIQQQTGGNLSEALANLSSVLRGRKSMKGKIQAMSSEAKASAMIIGSLPPGVMAMVYMTTPDYMSLLWTEPLGQMMAGGGVLWMGSGIFIMRKMINFNF